MEVGGNNIMFDPFTVNIVISLEYKYLVDMNFASIH